MQKLESSDLPRWQLLAAPHRAMFFSGTVLLLSSFVLWAAELAARVGLLASMPWALPAGWLHGLIVASGVLPLYMFGFLLTAMPRWQGQPDLQPRQWQPAWCLLASGWVLVMMGAFAKPLLMVSLCIILLGWGFLLKLLWQIARSPVADSTHAMLAFGGMAAGWCSILLWLLALLFDQLQWVRYALSIAVWWGLLPVFMAVSHRMIPFFTSSVSPGYTLYRPVWALWAIVLFSVVHGMLWLSGLAAWTWLVDLPSAVVALSLSMRWLHGARLQVRLLSMLHIGFAWLGIGLLLNAVQSAAMLVGMQYGGHAPLHLLLIGYFGSMLLAMVSRVTLGHSGRPLQADTHTWLLFLGLQVVVLLRAVADIVPGVAGGGVMLLAGSGWLFGFAFWSWHYLPIYWRARVDGKPG